VTQGLTDVQSNPSTATATFDPGREAMADVKDKVKSAIDTGAEKAKEVTDEAAEKSSQAAKKVGNAVQDAGQKIKDAGN
jgi:hypothetical protein